MAGFFTTINFHVYKNITWKDSLYLYSGSEEKLFSLEVSLKAILIPLKSVIFLYLQYLILKNNDP